MTEQKIGFTPCVHLLHAAGRHLGGSIANLPCASGTSPRFALLTVQDGCLAIERGGDRRMVPRHASLLLTPASEWRLLPNQGDVLDVIEFHLIEAGERTTHLPAVQRAGETWWSRLAVPLPQELWAMTRHAQRMIQASWWQCPLGWAEAHHELDLWLINVLQTFPSFGFRTLTSPLAGDDAISRAALDAMRRIDRASVARMAETASLSIGHFSDRFKERLGQTPGDWLDAERGTRAVRRLRSGEWPLIGIARSLGWSKVVTLRRHFRRVLAAEPDQFRPAHDLPG